VLVDVFLMSSERSASVPRGKTRKTQWTFWASLLARYLALHLLIWTYCIVLIFPRCLYLYRCAMNIDPF
jgi:hypothetical protein